MARLVCGDCGRSPSETPLRTLHDPRLARDPYICRECYGAPEGIAPGTGGLPYPAWDELAEAGRE